MPSWKFLRYKLDEAAQCEADSIKALKLEENCETKTKWAIKSPKGTFDYACCMTHREALKELGLL